MRVTVTQGLMSYVPYLVNLEQGSIMSRITQYKDPSQGSDLKDIY
jgi:hypothetical protein